MKILSRHIVQLLFFVAMFLFFGEIVSCKKYLPEDREGIGNSAFTKKVFEPVLGRTNYFSDNFFKGSTTYPVDFKIINPRHLDGTPAPELKDTFPVLVWKKAYTGKEESIDEILAERDTSYRPLWEIFPHSGDFVMWRSPYANVLRTKPDSGYIFDVELSNSGGRKYFRNFKLKPERERSYEPSNFDPVLGLSPGGTALHPTEVRNIKGGKTGRNLGSYDIDVFIHKVGNGQSLSFMFLDTLDQPINPRKFNLTDWEHVVHGFNMEMNDSMVTYQVVYPVPLTEKRTRYTNFTGKMAHVSFSFSRLGFGHIEEDGRISFDFRIYEKGDWQIVFAFKNENPKFEDD